LFGRADNPRCIPPYAILGREDRGWIEAEWGLSDNNRRAKFYRLTSSGRKELESRVRNWSRFTRAVDRVIQAVPREA
jgi:PadR family transcriptional regulator, regulatory protein PadR